MKPRGYFATFVRIFSKTFLPAAIIWSILFALGMGFEFKKVLPYGILVGIGFGLVFGLIMAILIRGIKVIISFEDRQSFIDKINITLAEIGYYLENQTKNFMEFKPSSRAGSSVGRIFVILEDKKSTIVGPVIYVKKLLKLLNKK